jgi:hypothetical protein
MTKNCKLMGSHILKAIYGEFHMQAYYIFTLF